MHAVVIFESMFGNTEEIARAVADGLTPDFDVTLVNVDDAPTSPAEGVDLVVVGGPTHAFGLSRSQTRKDAAGRVAGNVVSRRTGLREWLDATGPAGANVLAAAFGTRVTKASWAPGSAARGAEKRLRRHGYRIAGKTRDFYVEDTLGPLAAGELESAREWAAELASNTAARRTRQG